MIEFKIGIDCENDRLGLSDAEVEEGGTKEGDVRGIEGDEDDRKEAGSAGLKEVKVRVEPGAAEADRENVGRQAAGKSSESSSSSSSIPPSDPGPAVCAFSSRSVRPELSGPRSVSLSSYIWYDDVDCILVVVVILIAGSSSGGREVWETVAMQGSDGRGPVMRGDGDEDADRSTGGVVGIHYGRCLQPHQPVSRRTTVEIMIKLTRASMAVTRASNSV